MKFTPHPFQRVGIDHAADFFRRAVPGDKVGYSAPTGCGKSVVQLHVREEFPDLWIVTPRDEIVEGMLDKLGASGDSFEHRIATPVRLRNAIMRGDVAAPGRIIFDEGHHHSAETWQQLTLLSGMAPMAAYTATPYRGSPRSTRELLDFWGDFLPIITYDEAAREGYIKNPVFSVLPLVDDDIVEVSNGEFNVTSLESATVGRLGDAAEHARRWYNGIWDKATMFALPNTACCAEMHRELTSRGLPCAMVTASTPKSERWAIFEAVSARVLALLHINVVSEGIDLPIRRLVDLAPTMSPVRWVQQLGRITRPTEDTPEYVCCNRNLLRHAYALEGAVSVPQLVEAEKAFPPTERAHTRALGLEALGRFKGVPVKTLTGLTCHIYALSVPVGQLVVEYCCLVHPARDPEWFSKVNQVVDGAKQWGNWRKCEAPKNLQGFGSVPPSALSPKQEAWWKRSARNFGIDPDQEVNRKNFQVLPVLCDSGARV